MLETLLETKFIVMFTFYVIAFLALAYMLGYFDKKSATQKLE
jgi:hypothetical protein